MKRLELATRTERSDRFHESVGFRIGGIPPFPTAKAVMTAWSRSISNSDQYINKRARSCRNCPEGLPLFNSKEYSMHNTLFIKLIVTFLFVMTPIFLLGVYMYGWSVKSTKEKIFETTHSQITFYLADLESEIERMKLLQYGALDDTNLNKLALMSMVMGPIEQTEKINELRNRLYSIHNSSNLIQNVNVHIYPISKTISSSRGALEMDLDRYYDILFALQGKGAQIIKIQDELALSAIRQFGSPEEFPVFIIDIELDSEELQKSLRKLNTYPNSGTILVTESTDGLLVEGAKEFLMYDWTAMIDSVGLFTQNQPKMIELGDEDYYIAHAHSDYLNVSVYHLIPKAVIIEPLDKFIIWAWLFIFGAVAIMGIYVILTYKFIHKPLLALVKSFRRIEKGDLDFSINHDSNDEFRYLFKRFNQMISNLRSLINQVYKQKIMMQRSELKQLQSQINPHFLYNSFFILNTMSRTGDLERIEQFTVQLGEYFRFVTRNASDEVDLKNEIHHAKVYTEIQSIRFSRRIQIQFEEMPGELGRIRVPRLIVQPIIENAYEHSLERMPSDGLIAISFEQDMSQVRVIVEDNGRNLTDGALQRLQRNLADRDEYQETTGMINIHRRMTITYGGEGGLNVSRSKHGGLKAVLYFPNRRGEHDVPNADCR